MTWWLILAAIPAYVIITLVLYGAFSARGLKSATEKACVWPATFLIWFGEWLGRPRPKPEPQPEAPEAPEEGGKPSTF